MQKETRFPVYGDIRAHQADKKDIPSLAAIFSKSRQMAYHRPAGLRNNRLPGRRLSRYYPQKECLTRRMAGGRRD